MSGPRSATGRALAVLRHVADGGTTSNLSELARLTGVNRVTAMRLLTDLEAEGILEPAQGGRHRIGMEFLKLAARAMCTEDLTGLGRRVLRRLSEQLQLSAYLVVPDGDHVLYLLRSVPATPLVSNVAVGSRIPAHLVTPGRALLQGLTPEELRALLGPEPLSGGTAASPTTYAELERLLAEDAERGCAWSHGAYEPGIDACAAAVTDGSIRPVAALSVAGPTEALWHRRPAVEEAVTSAAADLAALLAP